jgi:hypothetical protein
MPNCLCRGAAQGPVRAIEDYVVEDHVHVLVTFKTQEVIDRSRKNGHAPLVSRVRHLNDKKKPDPLAGGVSVGSCSS